MSECRCGRPTRDEAYVCDTCANALSRSLGDVPWLDEELDITMTRQRSAPITGGAPSADRGLPWHDKAAECRRNLHALLVSWVRFCDEEEVRGKPTWEVQNNLPSLSRWMLNCVRGLTLHDIGPEVVDEITNAVAEAERIVFWKRRSRVYLGPCGHRVADENGVVVMEKCPGDVYADEGSPIGHCDECGEGVTVVIRKGDLERQLDDRLCTPAELARLCVILGLDAPRERVREKVNYWHRHKRIDQKGSDANGHPLFKYGEVRLMLYQAFRRDTA
jgi:hypothetical protein